VASGIDRTRSVNSEFGPGFPPGFLEQLIAPSDSLLCNAAALDPAALLQASSSPSCPERAACQFDNPEEKP